MRHLTSRHRTSGATAVLAVSLATLLSACGGGSPKASASGSSSSSRTTIAPSSGSGNGGANRTGGSFNGATGSVAAISGSSMEVQNPTSGQTTVNWTGTTTFDQMASLTAGALAAGDCVTVIGTTSNGTLTARTVSITTAPATGTCAAGFGPGRGRARAGGGGPTGTRPTGSVPNGGNRFAGNTSFAGGKVVSSSPTRLVIFGTSFNGSGSRTATSGPPTTAAPADVTVDLASSTVFSAIRPATAADLAVGDCVVANGPADSTGAVTARRIQITSTGGKSCATGFGRFGGAPAGTAAPASSPAANA